MNVLPFMEFISVGSNQAAQMKALVEQAHGLPFSVFIGLFFTYQDLDLTSQQTADGRGAPSRHDLGLLNGLSVQTDRHILLSTVLCSCHDIPSRTYYTCSTRATWSQPVILAHLVCLVTSRIGFAPGSCLPASSKSTESAIVS